MPEHGTPEWDTFCRKQVKFHYYDDERMRTDDDDSDNNNDDSNDDDDDGGEENSILVRFFAFAGGRLFGTNSRTRNCP